MIFSSLKLKDLLFDHDLIAFLTICIFQLLIETMWADFNKTLNTSSFDEGISNYSSPKDPERKRKRLCHILHKGFFAHKIVYKFV